MSATKLHRHRLRPGVAWPFPHDVDISPQLATIALAQAALAGLHLAIDSAHPVIRTLAQDGVPDLSDSEHYGALVLHVANQLAEILDDYAAAVVHDHPDADPPSFPF